MTCTPIDVRVDPAQLGRDHRAGVVADRAVALVAEARHQLLPRARGPRDVPAAVRRRPREPEARQGRDHQVVAGRGEGLDDVEVLDDRPRPAVREDQRDGVGGAGADVQEVDRLAVDLGGELRVRVEAGLERAPVERRAPVLRPGLHLAERDAVLGARAGDLVGPPGAGQPVLEVVELGLRDVDAEGLDGAHGGLLDLERNTSFRYSGD